MEKEILDSRKRRMKKRKIDNIRKRNRARVIVLFTLLLFLIGVSALLYTITSRSIDNKIKAENEKKRVEAELRLEVKRKKEAEIAVAQAEARKYKPEKNEEIYEGKKTVFITIDDGPSANITPKILDVLDKHQVKATFFTIGFIAETEKKMLREIANKGHTVACHGYSHDYNYIYASPENQIADTLKGWETIKKTLGDKFDYTDRIYRFPGGGQSESYEKYKKNLQTEEFYYFDWNATFGDSGPAAFDINRLLKNALTPLNAGSKGNVILLLHDAGPKDLNPEALDIVIKKYKDAGYQFKSLSEYCYGEVANVLE
ncbi:MAG: polysaccharide deacetylase family protein [Anaerovoracaceae bacterium]